MELRFCLEQKRSVPVGGSCGSQNPAQYGEQQNLSCRAAKFADRASGSRRRGEGDGNFVLGCPFWPPAREYASGQEIWVWKISARLLVRFEWTGGSAKKSDQGWFLLSRI